MNEAPSGYSLLLAYDSHPWMAAVDDMKYIYLICLGLMGVCMCATIRKAEKLYRQQILLEENRQDFTNAMAHELKTPLGVIRGFAENLLEKIHEEKREYYLRQIIGQTDEMDRLAEGLLREGVEALALIGTPCVMPKGRTGADPGRDRRTFHPGGNRCRGRMDVRG